MKFERKKVQFQMVVSGEGVFLDKFFKIIIILLIGHRNECFNFLN